MADTLRPFGTLPDGRTVHALTIGSAELRVEILTLGARLHSVSHQGSPNLLAGSPDLAGYLEALRFAGPIVGPVANRIAGARAEIAGKTFDFDPNQGGKHSCHSGDGVHGKIWEVSAAHDRSVTLTCLLPDGEGGFPGHRILRATYAVEDSDLTLTLAATTDAPTLMNPASHGVWRLDGTDSWEGHTLEVLSDRYLPTDADKIPTGDVAPVEGTPYDHLSPRAPDPSLDHNFCFAPARRPRLLARLTGATGRSLEVLSDAPGLQVYAGGARGIALEPQHWPDAPHHAHFPSILLRPGETFGQTTIFRFG